MNEISQFGIGRTEAVLIISRNQVETIIMRVIEHKMTSQPFLRCLGVMIDARLSFKQQVEHMSAKASVVGAIPSRLMPNVGDQKQKTRALLTCSLRDLRRKIRPETLLGGHARNKGSVGCNMIIRNGCPPRSSPYRKETS